MRNFATTENISVFKKGNIIVIVVPPQELITNADPENSEFCRFLLLLSKVNTTVN